MLLVVVEHRDPGNLCRPGTLCLPVVITLTRGTRAGLAHMRRRNFPDSRATSATRARCWPAAGTPPSWKRSDPATASSWPGAGTSATRSAPAPGGPAPVGYPPVAGGAGGAERTACIAIMPPGLLSPCSWVPLSALATPGRRGPARRQREAGARLPPPLCLISLNSSKVIPDVGGLSDVGMAPDCSRDFLGDR